MPHLFVDDLAVIEKILRDELHVRTFVIETTGYRYNSVSEIDNQNDPVVRLNITTHEPHIVINFNEHGASLYVSEDTIETLGAVSKIEEIIRKGERKTRWLNAQLAPGFLGASVVVFPIVITLSFKTRFFLAAYFCIVIFFLIIVWGRKSYNSQLREFCRVEFIKKKDRTSFWIRKKDDILLAVISAFLGTIFGVVMTVVFQNITA